MSNRFTGKHAAVTGGANGMGFEIARRLGLEGASLAIMDIDEAALIERYTNPQCRWHRCQSLSS